MNKIKQFVLSEEGRFFSTICCIIGFFSFPISLVPGLFPFLIPSIGCAFMGTFCCVIFYIERIKKEKLKFTPQEIANASEAWQQMKKEVQ